MNPSASVAAFAVRVRAVASLVAQEIAQLADVLIDCVDGGASVGFMAPLTRARAEAFWSTVAASLARGERLLWIAEDAGGRIVGTTQVILDLPENQPHRGDLAKMLVRRDARGHGVGAALLRAAESGALAAGRDLLVLDTASDAAERLYAREGWTRLGLIPRYALLPGGEACATMVFYKDLRPLAAR